MATATDQAPDTSTFDPDEFMKSRGAAAAPATAFDPDEFMKQRQAAAATPAAPKAAAQPAAPKAASGTQAPEGFGARLWRGLTTPLPRPPGGGEEEEIREGSGPAVTGLTAIGTAGVPVQAIAARSLAPFVPLVTGGLGAAAGSLLGRGAGSIAGFSEKGKDVAGDIGGLAGGTLGGLAAEPIRSAIANRNPVVRGTQAYQKIIAPTASKSRVQLDEAETIRRASPYLSEQAKLTPVKTGPGAGPKGQDLGVQNYRQNADIAASRLWDEKIAPLQDQYGAAPIDTVKVADEIRATHNPNGPPNPGKAKAVSELADHYGQPTTIKDAVEKVKALNEDKQVVAFEKAPPGSERAQLILADPAIEAKVRAANSLRDAIFDSIEQHGSKVDADYVRSARKDFGALKQVSENLNNASVPTPGGFVDKLMNTAGAVLRPRSGPAVANRFFNNPNKLAAKSSRLFGAANLTPEPAPPLRTTPWAPPAPTPFIAPPAPPQAPPNAAGQVTGIGSVVNPQAVGPRGTAGTRFAPKGLLPGPIAGTPAPQVGTPPPVGFPARIGMFEGFPNPQRAGPGFEPVPTTSVTTAPPPVRASVPPLQRPTGPQNKPLEFKRTDKAPEPAVKKMTSPADRYEAILKDPNATEEQKVEAQKKIDALKPKK